MRDTKYVSGATKLKARIQTITAALALPVLTNEIGQLLLRRTLTRFDEEVDPDRKPWAPLAKTTLERRRRAGGYSGKKILVQTGVLRSAIRIIRGDASGAIYTNTGAGVRIGVGDESVTGRAAAHQKGIGVPRRKFLGVGPLDIRAVDGLMRRAARNVENL